MKVRIEPDAPLGQQEIRARTVRGYSNPVLFAVGESPEIFEQEPNNTITNANPASVPITINGRIDGPKDVDQFRLAIKKDQPLIFELFASRFGSPLDGVLTLTDQGGKVIQENDDAVGADARIDRTLSEDGDLLVRVRDLLNRGGGNFAYRLIVRAPNPDFAIGFSPDSIRINRGGQSIVSVDLQRQEGFSGPVRVEFNSLPAGVSAEPLVIPPDSAVSPVIVISADESAPPGYHRVSLTGEGVINGERVERKGRPQTDGRVAKEAFLVVLDPPAFIIEPVSISARMDQNQSTVVECRLRRSAGFAGEVQVTAEGYSAGREPLTRNVDVEPVTLKADETRVRLKLNAKSGAETGTRQIVFRGEASMNGRKTVQYSRAIPLTIDGIPFTLASSLPRLAITSPADGIKSVASEAEFSIRVDRRGWFAGEIALAVEGLPEGIQVNSTNIPSGSVEAGFKLAASDKTPAGKEVPLTIVGTGSANGRSFQYRLTPITLTVNAPEASTPPTTVTSAAK